MRTTLTLDPDVAPRLQMVRHGPWAAARRARCGRANGARHSPRPVRHLACRRAEPRAERRVERRVAQRVPVVAAAPVSERMSDTSASRYGRPSVWKMSWNHSVGSAVYSCVHESHG